MILRMIILSFGYAALIGFFLALSFTFISAYNTEDKKITIAINNYGEADLEMVLIMFTAVFIPFLLWDFYEMHYNEIKRQRYEDENEL